MAVASYQDLIVWQKATDLSVECYRVTESLPKSELYGLSSQIRRAAVSISSKHCGRPRSTPHARIYPPPRLGIANGSRCELETQLLLASRIGYFGQSQIEPLLNLSGEIGRMLHTLIRRLEERL
jgi:four helix bundle protein